MAEKQVSKNLIGKTVVSKSGKKFGTVGDLVFEVRTGELIHFVLAEPTPYVGQINLEKGKKGELLVPFSAVIATDDFVVVDEADIV